MISKTKKVIIGSLLVGIAFYLDSLHINTQRFIVVWVGICVILYQLTKLNTNISKAPTYKCVFTKNIVTSKENNIIIGLRVETTLPFTPFIGLSVFSENHSIQKKDKNEDNHLYCGTFDAGIISRIIWNNGSFQCILEPEEITMEDFSFDDLTARYDTPWKIYIYKSEIKKILEDYIISLEDAIKPWEDKDKIKWHQNKLKRVMYQTQST